MIGMPVSLACGRNKAKHEQRSPKDEREISCLQAMFNVFSFVLLLFECLEISWTRRDICNEVRQMIPCLKFGYLLIQLFNRYRKDVL